MFGITCSYMFGVTCSSVLEPSTPAALPPAMKGVGRRGGRHQREARRPIAPAARSELAYWLTLRSLGGFCSAQNAQQIASLANKYIEAAMADGGDFAYSDLNVLAGMIRR